MELCDISKFETTIDIEKILNISTNYATDWEHFMIGTDHYLAVANFYNGTTYNIDSKIYKWNGSQFVEFQSIATHGAFNWKYFIIGTDHYLAVANYQNDISYNIDSKIYKWNGTQFVEFQSIATHGAEDWEYFMIGTDYYLVVANYLNKNSDIYKWNDNKFVEFQSILTDSASDWKHFMINSDHYLIVANDHNDKTHNIDSKIYKWDSNIDKFVLFQLIPTNGALDWEHFVIDNDHYLVVANCYNDLTVNKNSKIYKWNINTNKFDLFQSIPINGAFDWKYFVINNDHYLAVANYYNDLTGNINSYIYKINVSQNSKNITN